MTSDPTDTVRDDNLKPVGDDHTMATIDPAPLDSGLARVGDRWTLLIVDALLEGPKRYSDLADAVDGIAPNILAARLRKLKHNGLVVATPYSDRPRRLSYELTADGKDLAGALALLTAWATRLAGHDATGYHTTCGTALQTRPWCPTCERCLEPGEADDLDRL
jgi:DNA-binding HxlR family transcriptional regulator